MNDDLKYLPEEFLNRMNNMLGDDFQAFLNSYQQPRTFGLRVNTAKISCEEFEKIVPFPISPIPWIPGGYFYPENVRPSKCAFYQAGLYYLQEPSAMTPVSRLLPKPGEYILDMCAAPGGKATALGAALKGHGLLVANDISTSRARALLRNIELFGIPNSFVTSTAPKDLVPCFPEFFHKIILDAPCSGEGMFRKDEALAKDWSPAKSQELSLIQHELILQAADMLRPGGYLLYSTCTFAPQEDEGTVSYLLENRPDMELVEMPGYEGFSDGVPAWGKGQPAFFREIGLKSLGGQPFDWNRVEIKGDKVYYLPPVSCSIRRINFLRNGLYMGDLKKNRFEPSQPLALALHKGEVSSVITLPVQDQRLERYLKGETLLINPEEAASPKGWQLLCVEGYPLGFGKLVGQTLKNKYPSGWRL